MLILQISTVIAKSNEIFQSVNGIYYIHHVLLKKVRVQTASSAVFLKEKKKAIHFEALTSKIIIETWVILIISAKPQQNTWDHLQTFHPLNSPWSKMRLDHSLHLTISVIHNIKKNTKKNRLHNFGLTWHPGNVCIASCIKIFWKCQRNLNNQFAILQEGNLLYLGVLFTVLRFFSSSIFVKQIARAKRVITKVKMEFGKLKMCNNGNPIIVPISF